MTLAIRRRAERSLQLADLIGAVRLPTGAHRRAAGTDALTDLLIFRRRQPHSPPRSTEWQTTQPVDVDGRRGEDQQLPR